MKPFFPFLALSIALLPLSDVRAGEKTSFSSTASLPAMMKLNTGMEVNRDTVPVRAALPSEVTAAIPCDAQSVHFARYPLGPGGAPRLVHVWFEPNNLQPGDEDYGGAHHTKSMFEVDVFAPGVKAGTWKRVSFARYKTSNAPDNIQVRFLQPKVRRGHRVVRQHSLRRRGSADHHLARRCAALGFDFLWWRFPARSGARVHRGPRSEPEFWS